MGNNKEKNRRWRVWEWRVWESDGWLIFWSMLLVLVLLGLAIALTESAWLRAPGEGNASLEFESRKLFINFLLVVALGGLIGLMVHVVQHLRQLRHDQQEFEIKRTHDLLKRLTDSYLQVRSARRKLRLRSLSDDPSQLQDAMLQIDDARAELYLLDVEAKALAELFRDPTKVDLTPVSTQAKWMGDVFLKNVWSDYVDHVDRKPNAGSTLKAFCTPRDDPRSSFGSFAHAHSTARRELLTTLGVLSGEQKPTTGDEGVEMFVQIMEVLSSDREAMRRLMERWNEELRPGAQGFLGATAGVTDDGNSIVIARFDSQESAQANSARPRQSEWWGEMERCCDSEVTFTESDDVKEFRGGGSDSARFVQVMKMSGLDPSVMARLDEAMASVAPEARPELLGGLRIWTGPDRGYKVVYFTDEKAARKGEPADKTADAAPEAAEHLHALRSQTEFIDLTHPWMS